MDLNPVDRLPDSTLLKIFSHFDSKQLVLVSSICKRWLRVARDEQLWKRRFKIDFQSLDHDQSKTISWFNEYRRLIDECPRIPVQKLQEHKEQVLHTSFNHDGTLLATCSKDGTLKVWNTAGDDWKLLHDKNLRQLLYWKYTLCSKFNETSRLLLVSGLRAGESASQNGASNAGAIGLGELAVFEFVKKNKKDDSSSSDEDLIFRCRAINEPFDVYGCWFDNESILNSQSRRFNQTSSMADIYFLQAANEQTTSTRLFQFYNPTGGIVRNLCVSSYMKKSTNCNDKLLIFTTGKRADIPHQIGIKIVRSERITGPMEAANKNMETKAKNSNSLLSNGNEKKPKPRFTIINETSTVEKEEKPKESSRIDSESGKESAGENLEKSITKSQSDDQGKPKIENAIPTTSNSTTQITSSSEESSPTTSNPIVKEESSSESEEESDNEQNNSPNQQVQIRVHTFDRIDHVIETYGRIDGFTLSPDQRYIFINLRPFVDANAVEELLIDRNRQPICQRNFEIRVIDLESFTLCDWKLEKVDIQNDNPVQFFIDLSACDRYIISGGCESNAYIWDRLHRCLIGKLNHENSRIITSVSFHPRDPHICVSSSDDGAAMVWYSKCKVRKEK